MFKLTPAKITFALFGCVIGMILGKVVNSISPNPHVSDAQSYAVAISPAFRLKQYASSKPADVTMEYLQRYASPHEIGQQITQLLKVEPTPNATPPAPGKYSDAQLFDAYVEGVIPEIEEIVSAHGRERYNKSEYILTIVGGVLGLILGSLAPFTIGKGWRFLLTRIKELSLAVQGK